ncbi:MAG: cofactor-independent phosphoglycerate mutase [Nitrospinae bacterium]|nr:cofactor-independent phosphoglycerate mutase [Nitrospinota bacterium]
MKRVILLGDGMPDEPIEALGGKTPLMAAHTPNMDRMAREGTVGYVKTTPDGYAPGSDVTNMGILGYDPRKYYTGRAPLEAAAIGVPLGPTDIAYRCNLVTLAPTVEGVAMEDFSAGHIATAEAAELIKALDAHFGPESEFRFFPGVSYRHLMVWKNGVEDIKTTPPHDIQRQDIKNFLPQGEKGEKLRLLTGEAQMVLKKHPVNKGRKERKEPEANSIWLWGQGKAPSLPNLKELRGISGAMISAVDLMKGIGVMAGMDVICVPGVTGYIDTNYEGKAQAAIEALKDKDLVYIHVESPDESSHAGSLENKIKAIEDFDAKVVGPLLAEIGRLGGRAVVLSDHPCPLAIRTHSRGPVPFAMWPALDEGHPANGFDERISGNAQSLYFDEGFKMFERFIRP